MSRRKRNPLPAVEYLDRVDEKRKAEIDELLERVGVEIKDYNLVNRALSHKSYTNEQGYSHNEQYEKLEFFGDGVLGLIVNEYLFKVFPDSEEGELAKIKSAVVSEVSLAEVAREIRLSEVLLVGRGEVRSGGADRPSLIADVLEAFIGALYLDQGLPAARKFVLRYLESHIRNMSSEESVGDYKSFFQETVQKETGERPVYSLMRSSGPDHSRTFRIAVSIRGRRWGKGEGKSKKEAEQAAAEDAFRAWEEAKNNRRTGPGRRRGRCRSVEAEESRPEESRTVDPEITSDEMQEAIETESGEAAATKPDRASRGGRRGRRGRRGGQAENQSEGRGGRGEKKGKERRHEGADARHGRGARFWKDGAGASPEDFAPPKEVDDPVAWAAGETFRTFRRGRRR